MFIHYKAQAHDVILSHSIDERIVESAIVKAAPQHVRAHSFQVNIPGWMLHCENTVQSDDRFVTLVNVEGATFQGHNQ